MLSPTACEAFPLLLPQAYGRKCVSGPWETNSLIKTTSPYGNLKKLKCQNVISGSVPLPSFPSPPTSPSSSSVPLPCFASYQPSSASTARTPKKRPASGSIGDASNAHDVRIVDGRVTCAKPNCFLNANVKNVYLYRGDGKKARGCPISES